MSIIKKAASTTESNALAPVDKIRELLFGSQMDTYAEQFQRLEEMIVNENRKTSEELSKRILTAENILNQGIEKSQQALIREQKERTLAFNSLHEALQQGLKQLNDRLTGIETVNAQNLAEIKNALELDSQSLSAQIKACREELLQDIQNQSKQLETQKVSREQLADLFSGLSNQLHRS